ncbi:MAG: acyl carrier protein [Deltaproteobacteria bacterium]|nr:acyl carrier protein [Deltaproteobacteria bacterium]
MNDTEKKIRDIVAAMGNIGPDFDSKAHFFRDLGVESVKAIELLFELEDVFGIGLPDEDYNDVRNLDELVVLVDKLQAEA